MHDHGSYKRVSEAGSMWLDRHRQQVAIGSAVTVMLLAVAFGEGALQGGADIVIVALSQHIPAAAVVFTALLHTPKHAKRQLHVEAGCKRTLVTCWLRLFFLTNSTQQHRLYVLYNILLKLQYSNPTAVPRQRTTTTATALPFALPQQTI